MQKHQHGFTLVELSIVLVILGLLVGGVLTGQSLIRAAELRSVTTQEQRYITAVQTFRDKYFALPGDMTNATSYWGIVSGSTTGSDSACQTAASTTAATCNGNGDGKIANNASAANEAFRFWQHLANAGLIEGSYDGINHGTTWPYASTTANSPAGRISSSLWDSYYIGTGSGAGNFFDGQYDNVLAVGGILSNSAPLGIIFKPEEIYNIDTKVDDGKPATGKVVMAGTFGASIPCTDTTSSSNMAANYLLSSSSPACAILFRQAF